MTRMGGVRSTGKGPGMRERDVEKSKAERSRRDARSNTQPHGDHPDDCYGLFPPGMFNGVKVTESNDKIYHTLVGIRWCVACRMVIVGHGDNMKCGCDALAAMKDKPKGRFLPDIEDLSHTIEFDDGMDGEPKCGTCDESGEVETVRGKHHKLIGSKPCPDCGGKEK